MIWNRGKRATAPTSSPAVVCANGRPAHIAENGEDFTLVRYLGDDGPGISIRSDLVTTCTCGGQPEGGTCR